MDPERLVSQILELSKTPGTPLPLTLSAHEAKSLAETLGVRLHDFSSFNILGLKGDLGAGKTHFTQALFKGAYPDSNYQIESPTFTYHHHYSLKPSFNHFDLYRLTDPEGFYLMGFDEYVEGEGISCIEWPEKLNQRLPWNHLLIEIEHGTQDSERCYRFTYFKEFSS